MWKNTPSQFTVDLMAYASPDLPVVLVVARYEFQSRMPNGRMFLSMPMTRLV